MPVCLHAAGEMARTIAREAWRNTLTLCNNRCVGACPPDSAPTAPAQLRRFIRICWLRERHRVCSHRLPVIRRPTRRLNRSTGSPATEHVRSVVLLPRHFSRRFTQGFSYQLRIRPCSFLAGETAFFILKTSLVRWVTALGIYSARSDCRISSARGNLS